MIASGSAPAGRGRAPPRLELHLPHLQRAGEVRGELRGRQAGAAELGARLDSSWNPPSTIKCDGLVLGHPIVWIRASMIAFVTERR